MSTSANADTGSAGLAEKKIMVIGFGQRLVATVIDGALVVILSFILAAVVSIVPLLIGWLIPIPVTALIIPAGLLFSLIYYAGSWQKSGQTIGKIVMGIKVVGKDGSRLTWGKALLRYVGYIVSGIVASIGFLWVAFDRKRQGWHDKIASTYVIRAEDKFTAADQVEFVPSDPQRSWLWVIVWVVVAIVAPAGPFVGLLFLGPFVDRALMGIVQNLR
jgi:uncharacterized RDD family membrane protein YckC